MPAPHPRMHSRSHIHGGADPVHIAYEKIGGGGGGVSGSLVHRYIRFQKTLSSWPSGSWTGPLNFGTTTGIYTNDVDGSDMSLGGPAIIAGANYDHNGSTTPTKLLVKTPGLYLIQIAVNIAGTTADFDVGIKTEAGNSVLLGVFPVTWLRFSSSIAIAGGGNQGHARIVMLEHLTASKNVDVSVYQASGSTIGPTPFAVISLSYSKLTVVP